jgi:hypothetical protein
MGKVRLDCAVCGEGWLVERWKLSRSLSCPHCGSTYRRAEVARSSGPAGVSPSQVSTTGGDIFPKDDWDLHEAEVSPAGGLPATVIIGLALLPYGVPIFWLLGPILTGTVPPVSIATPLALAVSTSILCLSVIYTVDWSAETRLKGVFILILLSYFGGITLFFTEKATLERLYRLGKKTEWQEFEPDKGPLYRLKVPASPEEIPDQPLKLAEMQCYQARVPQDLLGWRIYVMAAGTPKPHPEVPGTPGWFEAAQKTLLEDGQKVLKRQFQANNGFLKGYEWEIELVGTDRMRVILVYVGQGKVYYLAVEGERIDAQHPDVQRFFRSFFIPQQP